MKSIDTLVPDIYALLQDKTSGWFDEQLAGNLSANLGRRLQLHLGGYEERRTLRLSAVGPRCPRALWCSVHSPELADTLSPWATLKYTYGHILEELLLTLAKAAGHSVVGEQDEVRLSGIVGHRDAVIDGYVLDVKSSSTRGMDKFKFNRLASEDPFGYLDQLDAYVVGSSDDDLVLHKNVGYILAVDKQLGHLVLYRHQVRRDYILNRIEECKRIVGTSVPPMCECRTVPEGKAGNMKLDIKASYSPYKHFCWPHLRTFAYSNGPMDLTVVKREPDVPEITRLNKVPSKAHNVQPVQFQ